MPQATISIDSYSQNGEDLVVLSALAGIKQGTFMDIGAGDGLRFSNSKALVDRGWSGVLVEPGLAAFAALQTIHSGNDKLTLVHAAVGGYNSLVEFHDCGDLYSTTETANHAKWAKYCKEQGIPFKPAYYIPQVSVDVLLDKFPIQWDVLSVDTEGTSVAVLSRCMKRMASYPPRCIVVEHDGGQAVCMSIVGSRYECIADTRENLVLLRRDK